VAWREGSDRQRRAEYITTRRQMHQFVRLAGNEDNDALMQACDHTLLITARSEIERLKTVIKTKDACLYNFSSTLRAADERAHAAEQQLQEEAMRRQHLQDEIVRMHGEHVIKEDALQSEIRKLAVQLSEGQPATTDLRMQHEM